MLEKARNNPRLIGGVYQVGQVITSGPMLAMSTAYNRNTGDVVGLLVFEVPPTIDTQTLERLLQPLEQRRSVKSPNVLGVYDWGVDGSRAYIVTGAPRGITLRHVLNNENVDLQRALDIAQQLARGLAALHTGGIAGLDLRPQLITVDVTEVMDRVQIDDVGLRSLLRGLGYIDSQRSDDIGFLDPCYAAPEHIQGGAIGPYSDVYQLGLVLFELVTGRLPFVGKNPAETGVLQSTSPIPPMAQFKHDVPASLQEVVNRALTKNPMQRFPNATAMLAALEAVQLPRRRLPGETVAGGQPTPRPLIGSETNEMRSLEDDVTLRARAIQGRTLATQTVGDGMAMVPAEENAYAYLCVEENGVETQRFAILEKDVVVGRADPKRGYTPNVDLTKLDPRMTVSRQHARIRYEDTFFYIEDLKSRNKTKLGALVLTPMKQELLQHGDALQFGAVHLVFKVPGMRDVRKKAGN
jgi:Protein kinase domain/FHA domain